MGSANASVLFDSSTSTVHSLATATQRATLQGIRWADGAIVGTPHQARPAVSLATALRTRRAHG
jgi:3-hydroxyisobutyrate dehydrogenase-like beta-hydroxyacid dehydrogenase